MVVYGDEVVLKVAAITKLTRNLGLAAVIPALAWRDRMQERLEETSSSIAADGSTKLRRSATMKFSQLFPSFVGGFIGMAGIQYFVEINRTTLQSLLLHPRYRSPHCR